MDLITLVILGGILGLVVIGIGLIIYGIRQSNKSAAIGERLQTFTESSLSLEEMELQQPFYQRIILPIMQALLAALGKMGPKQNAEKVKKQLQQAGNPGGITPQMFVGLRIGLAVGLMVIFGSVTLYSMENKMQALMYTGLGTVLGYLLPGMWLGNQIKKRAKNVLKSLPDCLDLLTISVEAGLGFDLALQRVSQKWDNEMTKEFKRVISDVQLGRSRREALRDMSDRTGVEDVKTFVSAIIQAEQLGVSMSKILRIQSDQLRQRRRQRAEEAAQKAPIYMLFPMVFFIFPAIFIVILGPAIPKMMNAFGGL